jgi:hypothetical protein
MEDTGDINMAFRWMNEGHQVGRKKYARTHLFWLSKDEDDVKLKEEDINAIDWYIVERDFVEPNKRINNYGDVPIVDNITAMQLKKLLSSIDEDAVIYFRDKDGRKISPIKLSYIVRESLGALFG